MSGENGDIIQYDNDKCIIKANKDNIDFIKKKILDNIKIDNMPDLIKKISKTKTYQFVAIPKEGYLLKYPDGTFSPLWRDKVTKRFLPQEHLKEVGMDVGNVCKLAANQAMFAYIIVQLEEVNKKLDIIMEDMQNDRISGIAGAIKAFEHYEGKNNESYSNIVLQIETGIAELERKLSQSFNKLNPNAKFSENWGKSKNKENEKIHKLFSDSVYWIFKGYETLLKIDQLSGKNTGTEHLIQFLQTGKWKELSELARGLEYKKSEFGYPEDRWIKIEKEKPLLVKNLKNVIDIEEKEINEYIIEFKGDDLLEVLK